MAFPSIASVTDTDFGTSVTSMSVNMPGTVNAGDRLVTLIHVRNAGTWTTVPSGWSTLGEQAGGGSVGELSVFEKIAAGTEGGTTPQWVTNTATTAAIQVLRITGAHASTASELTPSSGDATAANPASETASWGGTEDNLWLAVAGHSAASTSPWSAAPTNYSGFALNGASSGGAAVAVAHGYRQLAANTEDPGTFTVSGSNRWWAAYTIVIRPAAAGGDTELTVNDSALGLSLDATTLAQNHVVASQDANLALSLDNTTITQNHLLVPQDIGLGLATDSTTVVNTNYFLTVADVALGLSEDNTSVVNTNHFLAVADIALATAEDGTVISQNHVLITQDVTAGLALDNAVVSDGDAVLSASDMVLGLTTDNTAVGQNHILTAQDVSLALLADEATVAANLVLLTNNISLSLSEDATTIIQAHSFTVQDLALATGTDATTISQGHVIAVNDIGLTQRFTVVSLIRYDVVIDPGDGNTPGTWLSGDSPASTIAVGDDDQLATWTPGGANTTTVTTGDGNSQVTWMPGNQV